MRGQIQSSISITADASDSSTCDRSHMAGNRPIRIDEFQFSHDLLPVPPASPDNPQANLPSNRIQSYGTDVGVEGCKHVMPAV